MESEARLVAGTATPGEADRRRYTSNVLARVREHPETITVPLFFVVVVVAWEAIVRLREVPAYILPTPSQIVASFSTGLPLYLSGLQVTGVEILLGFGIGATAGVLLGSLLAQWRLLEATVYPYIVAFKAVPLLAIAPLFIIWFGFDLPSKIAVTSIVVFFPVMVNAMMGMKAAEPQKIAILRSVGASDWQILRMVKFPSALPHIFTGLEIGVIYAPIGAIVGEFVGARRGLGNQILQAQAQLEVARVFAIIVILAIVGISLYLTLRLVRRRLVFWAP
jgi:NitT/TauT family transport system permease protein